MRSLGEKEVEQAYRRLFPMVRQKCARMLRDPIEAQDVAQETFARLWQKRAGLRDPQALTAWIYRTSTRLAVDRLRRGRHTDAGAEVEPLEKTTPEQRTGAAVMLARLGKITPARELEAVVLSRIDGLTHAEIAEVLGVGERTVRRLLSAFEKRVEGLR